MEPALPDRSRVPQAGPQRRVEPALPDCSRVPQAGGFLEMLREQDLVDWLCEELGGPASRRVPEAAQRTAARRYFLSEYEIRQRLKDGTQVLKISPHSILSPLAQEWLSEKGIRIVLEGSHQ
ncbi:MAG: hypothetical protein HY402_00320 [Elusimicrobia bacterium]|nr:hypothetical protein [Elusimicrobiota bacterium]